MSSTLSVPYSPRKREGKLTPTKKQLRELAKQNAEIIENKDGSWCIQSASNPKHYYTVRLEAGTCNCPGFQGHGYCYHVPTCRQEAARRLEAEHRRKLRALQVEHEDAQLRLGISSKRAS